MGTKNISSSSYNTFITTLRQEQKQGFMLVKFQHKAGFFCGTLSNDKLIPGTYHETLAKTDENAKELVLKKIAEIIEAANGDLPSFVAEGEMDDPKEKIIQQDALVEAVEKEQDAMTWTEHLLKSGVNKTRLEESVEQLKSGNTVEVVMNNGSTVEFIDLEKEEKPQPKKQRRSRKAKSVEG